MKPIRISEHCGHCGEDLDEVVDFDDALRRWDCPVCGTALKRIGKRANTIYLKCPRDASEFALNMQNESREKYWPDVYAPCPEFDNSLEERKNKKRKHPKRQRWGVAWGWPWMGYDNDSSDAGEVDFAGVAAGGFDGGMGESKMRKLREDWLDDVEIDDNEETQLAKRLRTDKIIAWTSRMARRFGGAVYDLRGKSWDWGQALCVEQYGYNSNMWPDDPTEADVARADRWESGEWPKWVDRARMKLVDDLDEDMPPVFPGSPKPMKPVRFDAHKKLSRLVRECLNEQEFPRDPPDIDWDTDPDPDAEMYMIDNDEKIKAYIRDVRQEDSELSPYSDLFWRHVLIKIQEFAEEDNLPNADDLSHGYLWYALKPSYEESPERIVKETWAWYYDTPPSLPEDPDPEL